MKKRILIVEDHPIFRLGLTELINQEDDLEVCAGVDDVRSAWQVLDAGAPDLVIADITLPQGDGIELARDIHRRFKGRLPVLMLSMHDAFLYAERALHAGARGYLMKQEAMDTVVSAVREVLAGRIYLHDRIKEHILTGLAARPQDRDKPPMERLTGRELEVFRLIGQGLTSREIARRLHLSIKTIGTYRERIKEKLNLKHGTELVHVAVHWTQEARGGPGDDSENDASVE